MNQTRFAAMTRLFVRLPTFAVLLFSLTTSARPQSSEAPDSSASHSAKDILTENTPDDKVYNLRKVQFIDSATANLTAGELADLSFEFASEKVMPLFLDKEGLKGLVWPPGHQDWIDNQINGNEDIPPTIPLDQALRQLAELFKQDPPSLEKRNLPIPTRTEIDILKILWVEKEATSREIYAKLDTTHLLFAEELHEVLAQMVGRGFIDGKKITPSNELTLFGIARIEMSSHNRKNKQYIYWPIVTKEGLFTYMEAKRFLAMTAGERDNQAAHGAGYSESYERMLEEKLYRLFE